MLGYLQVCYKNKYITLQIDSEDISVKSKTKRTSQEEIQKKKIQEQVIKGIQNLIYFEQNESQQIHLLEVKHPYQRTKLIPATYV